MPRLGVSGSGPLELPLGTFKASPGSLLRSTQLILSVWMQEGLMGPSSGKDL